MSDPAAVRRTEVELAVLHTQLSKVRRVGLRWDCVAVVNRCVDVSNDMTSFSTADFVRNAIPPPRGDVLLRPQDGERTTILHTAGAHGDGPPARFGPGVLPGGGGPEGKAQYCVRSPGHAGEPCRTP